MFGGGFSGFEGFEGFEEHFGGARGGRKEKKEIDNTSLYKLLGVDKDAKPSQLKKAYFKLARKKHPDKGGDAKEFQEINAAYDILKDEDKRAAYDKYGMEGIKEGRGKGGGMGGGMGGMFEQMFSGGRQRQRETQRKAKGMLKEMKITLEECYNGGMKTFRFERYRICENCDGKGGEGVAKCKPCKGQGQIQKMMQFGPGMYQHVTQQCKDCQGEGVTIKTRCKVCKAQKIVAKQVVQEVPIEKGCPHEHDYVMTGEGHEAPGVMAGDLHVRFLIQSHRVFARKGADLFMDKKISLSEALTGFTFSVRHLDGSKLEVATMPGEVICHDQLKMVRGKGMPFFNDECSHGNLFVKFEVEFPKRGQLKAKQISLIKKLLPGPQHGEINYKENNYEILDDYDETDFNETQKERRSHEGQQGGQRVQCQNQ